MVDDHFRGVRSRAAIFGHPLHPLVVPFPIAFLVGALVSDITHAVTLVAFWAVMSKWLITAGLVMAAVAAVLGAIDFASIKRAREGWIGWAHMGGNVTAALLSLISLLYRWNDPVGGAEDVGLTLSVIVVAILGITGWLGGELVFRHKIGVIEDQPARFDIRAGRTHPAE